MDFIIFLHKVPWPLSSSYVYLFSLFHFFFFFPFVQFMKSSREMITLLWSRKHLLRKNESYLYVLLLLYRLFVYFKSERILFLIFYCVKLNMIIATLKGLMWVKDLYIFSIQVLKKDQFLLISSALHSLTLIFILCSAIVNVQFTYCSLDST